ncbi:MAG: lytic murein transglycosylase [Xanthobacteraceae bacterium]
MTEAPQSPDRTRRAWLKALAGTAAGLLLPHGAGAKAARAKHVTHKKHEKRAAKQIPFDQWTAAFRAKAEARGVTAATYARVMTGIKPDMTGLDAIRSQPEFHEPLWQYLNRAVSDWRAQTGRQKAEEYRALLARIEKDFGVAPASMLGVWGVESSFGDPLVQKNHMRPVFPSLAALAWAEPHRNAYWQGELINALMIVQRGWSTPAQMVGSWAGAMGHTQWMPEVWLHLGIDYNHDGKISPYGPPDDALATTARFFVERGHYRRGEHWGYEVRMPPRLARGRARSYAEWKRLGVVRADGDAFQRPDDRARPWLPVPGGPAFLLGANFFAVKSYNPSMSYTLALCHLGDRCMGGKPFVQQFPGGERAPIMAEIEEIQRRLTALGYDTGGTDGRVGNDTARAVQNYQRKIGMHPADGYAGVGLLARLRNGS